MDKNTSEFINQCRDDILNDGLTEGDYCVIMYTKIEHPPQVRWVHKIYKSLDDFSMLVEDHIKDIDPMFGIDFQLWYFD